MTAYPIDTGDIYNLNDAFINYHFGSDLGKSVPDSIYCPPAIPGGGVNPMEGEGLVKLVTEYGAVGNGSADDWAAFDAALQANDTVGVPEGRYMLSAPVVVPAGKQLVGVKGAVLSPLVPLDQTVLCQGLVQDIEIDNRGDDIVLTLNAERGEGLRLQVNGVAVGVTVRDCSPGNVASAFYSTGNGYQQFHRCTAINSGYSGFRVDGREVLISGCTVIYDTQRAGYKYRLFNANGSVNCVTIRDCVCRATVPEYLHCVFDFEGAPADYGRKVDIDGLILDFDDFVGELPSSQFFKFEDTGSVMLNRVITRCDSIVDNTHFVRISSSNTGLPSAATCYITNCIGYGGITGSVNGPKEHMRVENTALFKVNNQGVVERCRQTQNITFNNCTFVDFNYLVEDVETTINPRQTIKVNDVTFINTRDGLDSYLFVSPQRVDQVQIYSLTLDEQGTGRIFLSNSVEGRLMAGGNGQELLFDYDQVLYYSNRSGPVGYVSGSQTVARTLPEPDMTIGADSFPAVSGIIGQKIINMNSQNGFGNYWVYDSVNGWMSEADRAAVTAEDNSYTVATLPSASDYTGSSVLCTNGAAGQPVMVFSDGTSWLRVDNLTAPSA
jgi:hypothetical protein